MNNRLLRRGKFFLRKPDAMFLLLMGISLAALLAVFMITRGDVMDQFWFYDTADSGMDFFHSIEYVRARWPYEIYNTLYPPLANLLFLFMYIFVPKSVTENWTYDFQESVDMRRTQYDLRTYQSCFMLFVLFVIVVTLIIVAVSYQYLKYRKIKMAGLISVSFMFSFGILYSLERGNIILLATAMSLFFVCFYQSENKILREFSLIALAVAAGLKIYPSLLGLLLLKEKNIPVILRTVCYGIACFVFPCFAFREGLRALPMWLSIMADYSEKISLPWLGNGISSALAEGAHLLDILFGSSFAEVSYSLAGLLIGVLFLILALVVRKKWASALAITFAMLFQSQGDYICCMALVPLLLFLVEEKRFTPGNSVPFAVMMTMVLPLPLLYVRDAFYPRNTLVHIAMFVFFIWCIADAIKNIRLKCGGIRHEYLEK